MEGYIKPLGARDDEEVFEFGDHEPFHSHMFTSFLRFRPYFARFDKFK